MELTELKSIWKAYDSKLERSLKLNIHCLEMIQAQKVKSKLTPLLWQRGAEITSHSIFILLLLGFLYKNFFQLPYAISTIPLLAFYFIAFVNCLKQIRIIRQMDYSNDIITIQSSLVMLRTHNINLVRLACLFIPAYLAFPMIVSETIADFGFTGLDYLDVRSGYHGNWWTVQIISSIVLLPACIWLYRQVSFKNIHKKWVKDTIRKFSGTRVTKAIELVNEIEELKKGYSLS
jgi:hypothetical protein